MPEITPSTAARDENASSAESTPAPVRVAIFSDSLPERNGTGAYYHDLTAQLASRVEAMAVFQPLMKRRIDTFSIPMPGDPGQRLYTPNLFRINRQFRRLRPDIVVTVTPGLFGLLGRYHAWRSGAAYISAFHTDFEQLARIYWNPISRSAVNAILRTANRFICTRSAAVLVNNSSLEADVRALGASHVEIMGTPLQPDFLKLPPHATSEQVKQICFAGRLAAEKNIDLIIDAAREFPGIQFVIGGDGPKRRELERQAGDAANIRFTGWLDRNSLIGLLDDSDLLLLPSKLETFGSVALEAMARGRPALVSANAGIHDWAILRPGLFTLETGEKLAAAIRRIVEMPAPLRREKASAAREAAERLNNETLEQWIQVLQRYRRHGT